jgi:hypothetical protein
MASTGNAGVRHAARCCDERVPCDAIDRAVDPSPLFRGSRSPGTHRGQEGNSWARPVRSTSSASLAACVKRPPTRRRCKPRRTYCQKGPRSRSSAWAGFAELPSSLADGTRQRPAASGRTVAGRGRRCHRLSVSQRVQHGVQPVHGPSTQYVRARWPRAPSSGAPCNGFHTPGDRLRIAVATVSSSPSLWPAYGDVREAGQEVGILSVAPIEADPDRGGWAQQLARDMDRAPPTLSTATTIAITIVTTGAVGPDSGFLLAPTGRRVGAA